MATFGDISRRRNETVRKNRIRVKDEFINPYPWMSAVDARVHLYLEDQGVPFSYRYFDGESDHLKFYMPDYHPEFTLREYKVVIIVLGNYFSNLPGILDRNALAQVLLEQDGWKVVILFEDQIMTDLRGYLEKEVPALVFPSVKGRPRVSPFGLPDFMERRIAFLRALALRNKTNWFDPKRKVFSRDRFSVRRPTRPHGLTRTRWRVRR